MLVKLIKVDVKPEKRGQFSRGQRVWADLRSVNGFRGQTGGWLVDYPAQAVIIGLWQNQASYDRFMANRHDEIFERSEQKDTYDAGHVTLWNHRLAIPGRRAEISQAIIGGGFVRVALCDLKAGRQKHFAEVQEKIWNPGMARAGGLVAGVFCESADAADRFLVCTLWQSEDDHRRYREGVFHDLRARAQVDSDCIAVQGLLVHVDPNWQVGV